MVARVLRNKFCRSIDLSNEASVEDFFVSRLLKDLGYEDSEILPKHSIEELQIPRGRSRESYRPDYMMQHNGVPRWLIDAKSTHEDIDKWTYQCAGYALQINRKYPDRPCRYYMLTNGLLTRIYEWDQEAPLLSLRFADFVDGNPEYESLKQLLSAHTIRNLHQARTRNQRHNGHPFRHPTMDEVKKAFQRCHRIIWKAEKMSPQAAFVAFAKLLFIKLWEDRRLRSNPAHAEAISRGQALPADAVRFSTYWIKQQEMNDPNPMDTILFRQLLEQIEREITERRRKRIFEGNERLGVSPGTVKQVVKELEHYYLFGIDEDLNGRMFETFLAATMRGQDLGQYFTPRSIVKLMVRLARCHAGPDYIDTVLDACCGTGGFLIEAMADMRRQIYENASLTSRERDSLLDRIANQAIIGIDAGRDPKIARIARINMYLHGDGGSRVYMADGLRHPPRASEADTVEEQSEVRELAQLLENTRFDVVLTNPPFSMDYSLEVPEEREVLEGYSLLAYGGRRRKSLRSSVMFIERYWHLLKPGGRLLTVIDDSVLSGENYGYVRDFIREKFVIRAIISLPGDAFRQVGARAKTSILYLVKRSAPDETQPSAFVYESRYIGLDNVPPKTRETEAQAARERAFQEIEEITRSFDAYLRGEHGPWLVPPDRLGGRFDAKYLLPWSASSLEACWQTAGARTVVLSDIVEPIEELLKPERDETYTFLRITYEGRAERGETVLGKDISYGSAKKAKAGDIVVSHINAVNRAICVIPPEMEDLLISNEFTVLRIKPHAEADPFYLWFILRSSAIIAEWVSQASGLGRHRVNWDMLKNQKIPLLPMERQRAIRSLYEEAERYERRADEMKRQAWEQLASLNLEGVEPREKLERAKPPR